MAEIITNVQDGDILFMKDGDAAEALADRLNDTEIKAFIFVGDDPIEIIKLDDDILERAGLKRIEENPTD